jgi:serine/threonine protein kinase
VWFGRHRITGVKVAIKEMESAKYLRMTKENGISEGDAMELCSASSHIVGLVEEFTLGSKTYLVSKFINGGDLLSYLSNKGVDRLPEAEACFLFKQVV